MQGIEVRSTYVVEDAHLADDDVASFGDASQALGNFRKPPLD